MRYRYTFRDRRTRRVYERELRAARDRVAPLVELFARQLEKARKEEGAK